MQPRITTLKDKKLIGQFVTMSFADNRTFQLWSGFMPRRKEIQHVVGKELYSLQKYKPGFNFLNVDLHAEFEKGAAVEVENFDAVPPGMQAVELKGGLYAVFDYKGLPSAATPFFQYIFCEWLPTSAYETDDRFHFEILGEKYRKDSPESEEEIWIPVRKK